MKNETKFRSSKVVPFLKTLNNCHFFSIQQASISGTPDILACIGGTFVALELKSDKGKLSTLQQYQLEQIREAGGVSYVVFPNNWDVVKEKLQSLNSGEF